MGRVISEIVGQDQGSEIVAGVDFVSNRESGYPIFQTIQDCDVQADVVVDFAYPSLLYDVLEYCVEKQLPLVLCTTGLSEEMIGAVSESAKRVAILRSANMSLGVNVLLKLVQEAAKVFAGAGFDMEIVEKHHNQKLDAPSGTALAFADALNGAAGSGYHYKYDRSAEREKRGKQEIGISAVRGGTIVGEHEIIFAGFDEVIELKHSAYSKAVFGNGAVQAAKYLKGKCPGLYTMKDVIG
jgi:4-hydroxy-tetrahydrodipicolinate reductase